MHCAKFREARRQFAIGPEARPVKFHMSWTAHWLQGHDPLTAIAVLGQGKHVVAIFVPVAALLPQSARHQLRRADLAETGAAHPPTHVVFDNSVQHPAARMPEDGAGAFVLLMKQIEPLPDAAVI